MEKAVVLLSGGLDSATCLALAKSERFACHALSVAYGQKTRYELIAAEKIASALGASEHRLVHLDVDLFGTSALTNQQVAVPDHQPYHGIPVTYVPARNAIFLTLALAYAETIGCQHIFIGVNALDYSGYPDCRPAFIEAFQAMANLATKASDEGLKTTIHTPLIHLNKADIIRLGTRLGVDYGLTVTCYRLDNKGRACGQCDSCVLRANGFNAAGIIDPTHYR